MIIYHNNRVVSFQIRPYYAKIDVPLYVPRFVEVAVPAEMMDEQLALTVERYSTQLALLSNQSAASLSEIEKLGLAVKNGFMDGFVSCCWCCCC